MKNIINNQIYDKTLIQFIGQQEHEKTIYCFNLHWTTIIGKILTMILITVFFSSLIFIIYILHSTHLIDADVSKWLFMVVLIAYGYYFHSRMARIFDIIMRLYIVTNMRIIMIDKSIFFKDNKDIIDLKKIQDISSLKSGFWSNILGYGNIEITLSSTHGVKTLYDVPDPNEIVEIIDRAKRIYIEKHEKTKHPDRTIVNQGNNESTI